MNTKLLLKVKRVILAEPKRLDMNPWIELSYSSPCGTVACIAGWAKILSQPGATKRRFLSIATRFRSDCESEGDGRRELGINGAQAARLFWVDNWPREFREKYHAAKTTLERATVTAERIDEFIASNGEN